MNERNTITVFEHEKLTIHDGTPFGASHLKALIKFNDNNNNIYFTVIRDGIKFSQYVGVIRAGSLTIEIIPKADKEESVDKSAKPVWRNVLIDMLKECRLLRIHQMENARLKLRSNSILEIYMEIFLAETERLMRTGLIKKYKAIEGNSMALKGRLNFSKHFTKNIIHRERFYVNYSLYNNDNVYNGILQKTLRLITKINTSPWITDKVNRLLLDFPELPDIKVTLSTFGKLIFDRKSEDYREALLISKMLLLNYRPDVSGGAENVIAVLFDMNKLWEEFIYRRLKKEEASAGVLIKRQQSTNFWKPDGTVKSKSIRPDIVITQGDKNIVIDTKWKVLKGLIPSDDDLQQMFIYNLYWKCDKSILLYPSNFSDSGYGDYHDHNDNKQFSNKCRIEKFMIIENKKLKENLGGEIIKKVLAIPLQNTND